MTAAELARKVLLMRDAQKYYFRVRSSEALAASKQLERDIDASVAEILAPPGLFTEDTKS